MKTNKQHLSGALIREIVAATKATKTSSTLEVEKVKSFCADKEELEAREIHTS
jgi:hypothetical protein